MQLAKTLKTHSMPLSRLFIHVCLLALLFAACRPASPQTKERAAAEMAATIRQVAPWNATTNYDARAWRRLIDVARQACSAESNVVDLALSEYFDDSVKNVSWDDSSRAFLLLRVMFDLPENADLTNCFTSRSWMKGARLEINADGTANLAWPLVWNNGQPYLVHRAEGYSGRPYRPALEYRYLLRTYPKRNLSGKQAPDNVLNAAPPM